MPRDSAESIAAEIFRLRDIVTEEVSLVDRAANKRQFLIIKRSTTMPREIVKNQNGLFSTTSVLKMQQAARDELFKFSAGALEGLSQLIELVKTAEIEAEAEFPKEIPQRGSRKLAADVTQHVDKAAGATGDDAGEGDPKPENSGDADPESDAVIKAANLHKQLLKEKTDAIAACLEKISSGKLSGEDLDSEMDKVQGIMWSMRDTSKVANYDVAKNDGGDPAQDVNKSGHWMTTMQTMFDSLKDAVDKVKPPKDVQNVGAGHQPDTSTVGSFNDAFAKLQEQLATAQKAVDKVGELESVVKRQAQEIKTLKSGVDVPSSGEPVEVNKGDDDTGWPMDMNADTED